MFRVRVPYDILSTKRITYDKYWFALIMLKKYIYITHHFVVVSKLTSWYDTVNWNFAALLFTRCNRFQTELIFYWTIFSMIFTVFPTYNDLRTIRLWHIIFRRNYGNWEISHSLSCKIYETIFISLKLLKY